MSHLRLQMFERETKREKILEARQREIRLKERSRSEQSREEEAGREDGEEGPDQLVARAERDFYNMVEAEQRRRDSEEQADRVRTTHTFFSPPVSSSSSLHLLTDNELQKHRLHHNKPTMSQ